MNLIAIVYGMDQMPTECHECQYFYRSEKGDWWCSVLQMWISQEHKKHIDCPLRPLPIKNKYKHDSMLTIDYENDVTLADYQNVGWNACLKAITGETE